MTSYNYDASYEANNVNPDIDAQNVELDQNDFGDKVNKL